MRRLGWVLAVAACSSSRSEPPPSDPLPAAKPVRPIAPPDPVPPPPAPGPLHIEWSNVRAVDGCFYFSGPEGRDNKLVGEVTFETLELEGTRLRVRIADAVFEGTYERGTLSLVRQSRHDFSGPWKVNETLRGTYVDDVLRATYEYEECEVGSDRCPGTCTISADVTFRR